MASAIGRNDPCPCGSRKKYKHCCGTAGPAAGSSAPAGQPTTTASIRQAQEHLQAGRLAQAHALLSQVLHVASGNPDALHLMGLVAQRAGQHAAAVELFQSAIRANADPIYFVNLGNALHDLGRPAEAVACYRKAIHARPEYAEAYNNLGNALRDQGEPAEAEQSYRRALALRPKYAYAHNNLANVLRDRGLLDEAIQNYRDAIASNPRYAEAYNNLANALRDQGKLDAAIVAYRKALALVPGFVDAHSNLGNALLHQGHRAEAVASHRAAIALRPDNAVAHLNLGNALRALGSPGEAMESYRQAIELKADYAEAHFNLGVVLGEQGRIEPAISAYREALRIRPAYADAALNLGILLHVIDRPEEALACFRQAVEQKPGSAEAHHNLGIQLTDAGDLAAAAASFRTALRLKPGYADAHNGLGNALLTQGSYAEAEEQVRHALSLKPDHADAWGNLGSILAGLGRYDEAGESYRKAIALTPDGAAAYNNLAGVFIIQGRFDEAAECYRKALALKPENLSTYSNYLFAHAYHFLGGTAEYLELARGCELSCLPQAARLAARDRRFRRAPLAGRRLRVGYVSGDFRQHAASHFLVELFSRHDRDRIELFAYTTSPLRDAVSERLQALAEHWVPVAGRPDSAVRDRIEADAIDVLIDLSGHTAGNGLGAIARRAAPVQVHYLGYFASTGLTEMDYWIGDPILTPAATDAHFSERVWRLPRVWVSYEGNAAAPLPQWHPAEDGTVWLGSFNNLGKLTPASMALWARVLHALPQGRLLLKTRDLADSGCRRRVLDDFARQGIPASRIELQDANVTPSWDEHMAYYNRLDIALDPVGAVGGGTTTCDALWMAVPVVALLGDRMASRMTASMLDAIGHPEWVARSEAEYIGKVVALAGDVDRRMALRSRQRAEMAASPLCDAPGLARELELAYIAMFGRWLEAQDGANAMVTAPTFAGCTTRAADTGTP